MFVVLLGPILIALLMAPVVAQITVLRMNQQILDAEIARMLNKPMRIKPLAEIQLEVEVENPIRF